MTLFGFALFTLKLHQCKQQFLPMELGNDFYASLVRVFWRQRGWCGMKRPCSVTHQLGSKYKSFCLTHFHLLMFSFPIYMTRMLIRIQCMYFTVWSCTKAANGLRVSTGLRSLYMIFPLYFLPLEVSSTISSSKLEKNLGLREVK